MSSPQLAVLAVLLLRGAQTVEEVRELVADHPLLETASEVEAVLDSLAGRTPTPFATRMPVAGFRREVRWVEVLTGWPDPEDAEDPAVESTEPMPATYTAPAAAPAVATGPSPLTMVELADRLSNIERRLAGIEAVLGSVQRALEGRATDQPPSRLRA